MGEIGLRGARANGFRAVSPMRFVVARKLGFRIDAVFVDCGGVASENDRV